jgi:hypothetical protein
MLLGAVIVLMNLERTLRVSTGSMRWQIKFVILGIGSLFAVQIYTNSQVVLFSAISMQLKAVTAAAIIAANMLMCVSQCHRLLNRNHPSVPRSQLHAPCSWHLSFAVGFAKIIDYFGVKLCLETFCLYGLEGLPSCYCRSAPPTTRQLISRHFFAALPPV